MSADDATLIDRLVTPELRDEIAAVTVDVRALAFQLAVLGGRAAAASDRFERALAGAIDDDFADATVASGHEAMWFACLETADRLSGWTGSTL